MAVAFQFSYEDANGNQLFDEPVHVPSHLKEFIDLCSSEALGEKQSRKFDDLVAEIDGFSTSFRAFTCAIQTPASSVTGAALYRLFTYVEKQR